MLIFLERRKTHSEWASELEKLKLPVLIQRPHFTDEKAQTQRESHCPRSRNKWVTWTGIQFYWLSSSPVDPNIGPHRGITGVLLTITRSGSPVDQVSQNICRADLSSSLLKTSLEDSHVQLGWEPFLRIWKQRWRNTTQLIQHSLIKIKQVPYQHKISYTTWTLS